MNRAVTTLAIALSLFPFTLGAQTPSRGFIVPEGATEIFALQKSQHLDLLRSVPPGVGAPRATVCDPAASSFSWRTQGKVTAAKNQQQCGACWAFSTVSAVETSFMVFHNTDQFGPDLSEQELLDCAEQFRATAFSSIPYDCTGGWFEAPMRMAQVKGILGNPIYPATPPSGYRSAKGACQAVTAQRTPVNSWTPLPSVQGPNNWVAPDREIKDALCTYGGVVAALNSQGFPGLGATFTTPLEGPASGTSQSLTSSGAAVDHAIHIVGWNDAEGVWIIKNSWGENWGDMGFAKIRYGTRNIGFMATAAQANTALVVRALPPAAAADFLNRRENSITSFSTTLARQRQR